jgi:hypothetical protein
MQRQFEPRLTTRDGLTQVPKKGMPEYCRPERYSLEKASDQFPMDLERNVA